VQIGTFYGISVGPGDPELITLKGLRLLQKSSIVAFPAGINGKLGIAEQIVESWLSPNQQKLALHFPYVRDEEVLRQAWQEAAQEVWQNLKMGHNVAFVCEGDVSFYSTFTYLAQTLSELHPEVVIESIPGVCSPMAAAANLGIPLTVRDRCLAILPALYNVQELETALKWADVVVLMKFSSVYDRIWQILERHNLLESASIVERATCEDRVIYKDLRDRPHLKLSYFSLLIVHNHLKL
jgi:precorrin-2/cobalt-factor-2 C20-methyltransferase